METPRTALVADDDDASRRVVTRALQDRGWTVLEASDGRAAMALVNTQKLDLAVLDWMMPYADGLEVATYLREHQPGVPVLLLTSMDEDHDVANAYADGVDLHLGKPATPETLTLFVDRLMARKD